MADPAQAELALMRTNMEAEKPSAKQNNGTLLLLRYVVMVSYRLSGSKKFVVPFQMIWLDCRKVHDHDEEFFLI